MPRWWTGRRAGTAMPTGSSRRPSGDAAARPGVRNPRVRSLALGTRPVNCQVGRIQSRLAYRKQLCIIKQMPAQGRDLRIRRTPRALRVAPALPWSLGTAPPRRGHALLINPFYSKDPNASFGKHVLTPTLALTSIAASTPVEWTVQYWDENLLQGPPPVEPFPEVVGISVHLTFARRA